jgi:geranylgeranyl diphosphate synthase type II
MEMIIRAAGANGMVSGQSLDMFYENKDVGEDTIKLIYSRKTGALITASVTAGAILGGAGRPAVGNMEKLGHLIGYSFQILDDILDVTSTAEEMGKPAGSDIKNNKNTYVSVYGLEKARSEYERLTGEAQALFDKMELKTNSLRELTDKIIYRKK